MIIKFIITIFLTVLLSGCGKVGPLALPDNKLDKSIISYPCNDDCMKEFEEEKLRQKKIILQSN
jgi:predicted small lipoprotein YifL